MNSALALALALLTSFMTNAAQAARHSSGNFEISLQSTIETSPEPLTTDRIATLDPAQPNPHLRRWVVSRNIEVPVWSARKLSSGLIGVQGGGIGGTSTIYLRSQGPWYDTIAQFPCAEKKPDPVFATLNGSRAEAQAAAKLWVEMLSAGKLKLSLLISRVAAVNEHSARQKADRVFQEWISRLDREWRARVASEVIPHQWKQDRKQAEQAGYCLASSKSKKAKPSIKPTTPDVWMEQEVSAPSATPVVLPLARAPSRRWQGWFAVRMDVGVGENSVLGQMVIDPATPRSLLSPEWLKGQGMPPEWIRVPEAQPERVKIDVGADAGETGLGEVTHVEKAVISDYRISVSRFLLFDTSELFDEPEFVAPCCSGILGIDLLRRYVVEFRGAKPNEVNLWPLQSYHPPQGYEWVEVRENAKGDLVPVCSTDRVKALIAKDANAEKLCRDPRRSLREASATIVFDLPHGRVWYSPEELAAPDYKNTSGLTLNYVYIKGDRALVVQSIQPKSVAYQLEKAGLKKGMVVTEIDGLPTLEMDLWEVNRRLAGVYGDTVKLQWQTQKGFQVEPLKVLERQIRNP